MIELTASPRHFEAGMKKAHTTVRKFTNFRHFTIRQQAVLRFIVDFIAVRHKPPTIREIQAHFGFRSTNSVVSHLNALERHSLIRRVKGESRNIEVLNRCTNSNKPEDAVE